MTGVDGDFGWDQYLYILEEAVLAVDTAVMNGGTPDWLDAKVPREPIRSRKSRT